MIDEETKNKLNEKMFEVIEDGKISLLKNYDFLCDGG
jgi:hypothetical protein